MKKPLPLGLALLLLLPALAWADPPRPPDPLRPADPQALLGQLATAAQQLSYSGIFVFQHEGGMEASRVVHTFERGQEKTRIDTLDGPPREIIRLNDEMRCYFPDVHAIRLQRAESRHFFPALIAPPFETYSDNYDISVVGQDRVAGHDCHVIALRPRDPLRYAHEFCADTATSLLLRAVTLGPHGEPIQMSVFTAVTIGGHPDPAQFRPAFPGTDNWRQDSVPSLGPEADHSGWVVSNAPPGFHKIVEVRRPMPGHNAAMTHLVYSDGLSTVSVFIEPAEGEAPRPDRVEMLPNALSYYSARRDDRQITAVGEVPLASIKQIGQSVINLRSSHP
ncbi:MAG: MucB/RseB C-terminal domain-containing protein [Betaproteobacteria bacterium]|nr:MucB/RseB C-terminal domain-containing protein [Betaproteobacteria bacterium]MDE2212163.1 MucB/RseB C-terminal domain-containing protein [Betaproteobacteria bacterium]